MDTQTSNQWTPSQDIYVQHLIEMHLTHQTPKLSVEELNMTSDEKTAVEDYVKTMMNENINFINHNDISFFMSCD